jgi:general secretion pathway protein G
MKAFRINRVKGFTLVEIMIVVAIIGIIVSIAVPAFLRARENSRGRACQENLMKIDGAVEQWALDFRESNGSSVGMAGIVGSDMYLKRTPLCPSGGDYSGSAVDTFVVGSDPTCSIGSSSDPFVHHVIPDENSAFN